MITESEDFLAKPKKENDNYLGCVANDSPLELLQQLLLLIDKKKKPPT